MADATRPLPRLDEPDTAGFWAGTQDKELRYQKCDDCGTVIWHPRAHCTGCLGGSLSTHVASGKGTVYTYSIVRQSYHPFFRDQVPYAIAWVDLEEGPRLLSNVVGIDADQVRCDMPVEVQWEEHEGCSIPLFRPR